jgi:hypothetical protein
MKKLLLLPILALFIAACSADNDEPVIATEAASLGITETTEPEEQSQDIPTCFDSSSLTAYTEIDMSNGFGNGTITFVGQLPAATTDTYKVSVEIEEISECEDLTSGTGNVRTFSAIQTYISNSNTLPAIAGVAPADTFACYRWRMVFERVHASGTVSCKASTVWYDSPLL